MKLELLCNQCDGIKNRGNLHKIRRELIETKDNQSYKEKSITKEKDISISLRE